MTTPANPPDAPSAPAAGSATASSPAAPPAPPAAPPATAAPTPPTAPAAELSFTLDGVKIPFKKGETLIAAAYRAGIEIPHYCWHPGLSVAANCRMCLVEIEPAANQRPMMLDVLKWDPSKNDYVVDRKPKLQPGCQMAAADGMVVKSETSAHVALARKNVQEFLLLNHPVDCPICDQAGECKLQDYYMSEQATPKRMRDEPNHKPKGVSFGDTIVYDAERCIACTRCIRFCDEVAGDHMLDMRERGNLYEITTSPGRTLEGHYTMMTEWVCPVGALTTSHWRHKGRVWLLKGTPSVCPGCATGCNTYVDIDPREQTAFRTRPRENEEVNKFWMCDDGMVSYLRIHKGRATDAKVGRGSSAKTVPVEEAVLKAAAEIGKAGNSVAVVLSAQASCEDNLVAVDIAKAVGGTLFLTGKPAWDGDKILRNADQNPNRAGALKVAGVETLDSAKKLLSDVGKFSAVLWLGSDADVPEEALSELGAVSSVVVLASHGGCAEKYATVFLPAGTFAETEGSFMNAKGMLQGFKRAMALKGDALSGWDALARVGRAMKLDLSYKRFTEVRAALTTRVGAPLPIREHALAPNGHDTLTPRSGV